MSVKDDLDSSQESESLIISTDEKSGGCGLSDADYREKNLQILAACKAGNIDDLKDLAASKGGFLTDANRARAWPILLGSVNPGCSTDLDGKADNAPGPELRPDESKAAEGWRNLPRHPDEDQVKLDVDRSFVYYPNDNTQAELDSKKAELSDLITEVLRRLPYLCYFQGYHDICQVFLLVLPAPLRAAAVARLSSLRIRDFMLPNLRPAVAQLRLIPDILGAADRELCAHLSRTEPYFALSDTLTMFAHNVQRLGHISRLFDALLAREPAFPLYVFAQMALLRRADLLAHDEPDMLHFALSKLPQDQTVALDGLDAVVEGAARLAEAHPPESLRAWRHISGASVLKTARDVGACARQSLDDGRRFFDAQLRELRWVDRCDALRKYDTWPNRVAVLTVLVGVAAALYVRRGGGFGALLQH
ncbi:hypothetical protein DL766_002570 [Monosporascus sp. MC13-8B]|uniref:Rab-GAP TBC domain-containing protein n=1 Tax=Monosporascus cannonballus TaxID=155416 RepID=A0ABY0GS69_9PEZI|nr:hypothetical protein DL762_010021 [Monosporascus cannonballus]RYP01075.1 hypothetical protein DL763_000496 [Monosporascus cannonballus]RYP35394.1 hypothetical protein DL766_002570 [Monosporascus sp. MC13-8B]